MMAVLGSFVGVLIGIQCLFWHHCWRSRKDKREFAARYGYELPEDFRRRDGLVAFWQSFGGWRWIARRGWRDA